MVVMRTDLGTTRESARRMRFEPTAGISATNVQKAIEGVVGASLQALVTPSVKVATGNIDATDVVVQVNAAGAITLTLPLSTAWATLNAKYGVPLSIFDISGNAAANNVSFLTSGGELVSGMATLPAIMTNYGGWRIEPKSGGGWVII